MTDTPNSSPTTSSTTSKLDDYVVFSNSVNEDDHYPAMWQVYHDDKSKTMPFHWPAALAILPWCFFRKLYVIGLAVEVSIIVIGISLTLAITHTANIQAEETSNWIRLLCLTMTNLVIRFYFGRSANKLYFNLANRNIKKADQLGLSSSDRQMFLLQQGGTSGLALIIAVCFYTLALIV